MRRKQNKKGFTLAELLIVVAIIAVLVEISIPIFSAQLEKSRRAVDLANARSVESALGTMINDGTVQLEKGKGIWVFVQSSDPQRMIYNTTYTQYNDKTFFIGADDGTIINGKKHDNWQIQDDTLANVIKGCFGPEGVKLYCGKPDMKINNIEGWDWYIVEFYNNNGNIIGKIYSGKKGDTSGISDLINNKTVTNIEKYMKQS